MILEMVLTPDVACEEKAADVCDGAQPPFHYS